jgi:hypothetical protein
MGKVSMTAKEFDSLGARPPQWWEDSPEAVEVAQRVADLLPRLDVVSYKLAAMNIGPASGQA